MAAKPSTSAKTAPRGRPFKPGESGNPAGKPRGARNRSTTLALTEAVDAEVLARHGRTPRQIARLLRATPRAVEEALRQARRLLDASSVRFAEDLLTASRIAASRGEHKAALAALQSIEVVKPVAPLYDHQSAQATAAVQVQFVGFGFAGLPTSAPAENTTPVINVTPTTR